MPAAKPAEFRRRTVELAREGQILMAQVAQVARDLGISESGLRRWMAHADVDKGKKQGLSSSKWAKLVRVRRKNRVLHIESKILKRAAAYSAEENVPPE